MTLCSSKLKNMICPPTASGDLGSPKRWNGRVGEDWRRGRASRFWQEA